MTDLAMKCFHAFKAAYDKNPNPRHLVFMRDIRRELAGMGTPAPADIVREAMGELVRARLVVFHKNAGRPRKAHA